MKKKDKAQAAPETPDTHIQPEQPEQPETAEAPEATLEGEVHVATAEEWQAALELAFEKAAELRDYMLELKGYLKD